MSSKAKAPTRTITLYSRITIWLALLFITGGLAFQSIQVNLFTQLDVDQAFANAMAEQMTHALRIRLQDTRRLQQAASNHPSTYAALQQDDPAWKATLRQFLPGVISLSLLTRSDAMGLQKTHGFAVQELVSRTLRGADMRMEAVNLNGKGTRFFWASAIRSPEGRIAGVLLAEYGADWLGQFRSGTSDQMGQIVVNQFVGDDRSSGVEIFRTGNTPQRSGTIVTLPINDYWYLTYIPSDKRPQLSLLPLVTPWLVVLSATLLGLFALVWAQKRDILQNQLRLLTYVRGLSRKGIDERPQFSLQLFHELADNMHHLIKTLRPLQTSSPQDKPARERMEVPLRQPRKNTAATASSSQPATGITVEEVEQEAIPPISQGIFRAYDIRGVVGQGLTEDTCYWTGRALAAEMKERGLSRLCLAWDGRESSPALAAALQKGAVEAGCDVISLGAQPTGLLYYATHETDASCGVVVTGSHNPPQYNGLKIVLDRQPLAGDALMALYHRIARHDLPRGQGSVEKRHLAQAYLERIENDVQISRDLRIVVDAGNGIAGPLARQLMDMLHVAAECLYCEVDGRFPNHHPDPSDPANLADLQRMVKDHQADLGLAFDGDGDRVFLVDNNGKIIWPDRMLMLLIEDILPRNPGRDVIYDVKSSRHLAALISRHGGRPAMWQTGHSLMKRRMQELNAVVGGEFSGHFYIHDRWYGFDDGLYTAARLLEILSQRPQSVSDVFAALPEDVSTAELTIDTDEQKKFTLIEALAKDTALTQSARVFTLDGLRIEFSDGWGLIRASNTTPRLTLRFAGNDQAAVDRISALMKQALTRHAPELRLPF
ncbi:MAG: phosphomannomutase/phosphoglucomutase [Pseudomonadota bacterium]|nr:phosphomannomutase/phosphoglucomutase [Pseudomonadota bacterium]